jgi:K+ transporter
VRSDRHELSHNRSEDGYERSRKRLARAVDEFMHSIKSENLPRVPGTGVFLTRTSRDAPPDMIWHVKQNRALQENLFYPERSDRIGTMRQEFGTPSRD